MIKLVLKKVAAGAYFFNMQREKSDLLMCTDQAREDNWANPLTHRLIGPLGSVHRPNGGSNLLWQYDSVLFLFLFVFPFFLFD